MYNVRYELVQGTIHAQGSLNELQNQNVEFLNMLNLNFKEDGDADSGETTDLEADMVIIFRLTFHYYSTMEINENTYQCLGLDETTRILVHNMSLRFCFYTVVHALNIISAL